MNITEDCVSNLRPLDVKKFLWRHVLTQVKSTCLGFLFLFIPLTQSIAQARPANEQQIKAAFLYNFTHFIDWPASTFASAKAPFVIGIVGDDPIAKYLNDLVKDEMLNNRNIIIQKFPNYRDIGTCNILYIPNKEAMKMKSLLPELNRRGILTVVDDGDFSKWGGIVCFLKNNNKLRLQINISEAKAAELTISSKLMNVSDIYKAN